VSTAADVWPAPPADRPIHATVQIPGSKSQTNRALVLAALATSPTHVHRPLRARDTELMADALRALGAGIEPDHTSGPDTDEPGWAVTPGPLVGHVSVHCGLAGTVMRFVPPLAALADGPVTFDGDPQARERPIGPLLDALRALDVGVTTTGRDALPFTIHGTGAVGGGRVSIDARGSSQFVSALLLAGCAFEAGLQLSARGAVPSQPHIDMTLTMLRAAGVTVHSLSDHAWRVEPGRPRGGLVRVAPDLSNAAPFLAAALVTAGTVRIPHWASATSQPARQILDVFEALGASARLDQDALVLTGGGRLPGVDLDLRDVSELVATVAVVAAVADGPTTIRGVAHVRGHETDRLAALATEINGLGGQVEQTDDGLRIHPRPLHGGTFHTYADHRLATAGAILGLVVPGVGIENVATTSKTMPNFTARWSAMVAESAA